MTKNSGGLPLSCKEICLSFGSFQVLKDVEFSLQPGRVHAITGENGAGKSSLAKVMAGIYRQQSGSVLIGDEVLRLSSPKAAQSHGIALIHQEPLPFEHLSISENIFCGSLPTRWGSVDWAMLHKRAQEVLLELGLELDVKRSAEGLSIADQQLLELASALAMDTKYFIFDETTAPLTPKETEGLFKVIRSLTARGCAVGIVSHHMHEVFEISDEITVLRDGEKAAHYETSETTPAQVIRSMVGRDFDPGIHDRKSEHAERVLDVQNLSGPGFSDISFSIRSGEIFGLAGLVGAGRTEVIRSIFGIAPIDSGEITISGEQHAPKSTSDSIARGMALVPEDRRSDGLFAGRSVLENTSITTVHKHLNRLWMIDQSTEAAEAAEALDTLNVAMRGLDQDVDTLSGGNQQKVVLGRWLMSHPKLLILDEPTRGVDISAKADVHQKIHSLAEQGVAILVVSSDLLEVIALCDRVGVMRRGSMVGSLERSELSEESIMEMAAL